MRSRTWYLVVPAIAMAAIVGARAESQEAVPLYTGEDLDRMFGPPPAQPSDPVDKTRPEDWRWVEQFLDRQYSRIDADRDYELRGRTLDIAAARVPPRSTYYGGALAWGLGYPASIWWQSVAGRYSWPSGHATYSYGHQPTTRLEHSRGPFEGQRRFRGLGQGHTQAHRR